jgi:class III poly(R)-hydroxyalkanoic acid synthase PhaE subunit
MAGTPKPGDFQSAKSVPDMMLKMLQPLWGYSIKIQKQWAEMTGATATGESENMAELAKQMTKTFYEAQGEDFRKILNVPQLGLNRYYQERQNKAIEKASEFQSALTEFLQMLMIPLEKAHYGVQEEIAKMEKEGKAAIKDSKALYQLWIQKLEDHYMALLRSDEYMNTLRGTLNSLHDFRAARAEFFMDQLQNLPIPTNKEMDELYKDLYILKKRVKELERKVKRDAKR